MSPRNRYRRTLDLFSNRPLLAAAWVSAALSVSIFAGCSLNKDGFRADKLFTRIGGSGQGPGNIIEPKRCMLEIAIITRPIGDKTINDSVWNVADVQCIPEDARRSLEANGVKIGKIIGSLPVDLESALHAPPPHKVDPITYVPEINEAVQIRTAVTVPQLSLVTNLDGRAIAKDYEQASGYLRVTTDHDGERGVSLRILPEIHYGPMKQGFQPIASPGPYPVNQLTISNSQEQDSLQELMSSTIIQPGEVVLISCDAAQDRTLGSFLFTFVEANSDRKMQHLVMIWASRNKTGTIEADKLHTPVDRPQEKRGSKPDSKAGLTTKDEALDTSRKAAGFKSNSQPSDL